MPGSRFAAVAARLCDVQGHSCAHFHAYNRWASNLHPCVGKCPGGTVLTSCIDTRSTLVPPEQGQRALVRGTACPTQSGVRSLGTCERSQVSPQTRSSRPMRPGTWGASSVLLLCAFDSIPSACVTVILEPRPYTRVCRVFRLFGVWPQDPSAQVRGYVVRLQGLRNCWLSFLILPPPRQLVSESVYVAVMAWCEQR